jgi:hypothetical protein
LVVRRESRSFPCAPQTKERGLGLSQLTLIGNGGSTGWVWNYRCDCGLVYRVRSVAGGAKFWPAAGVPSYNQNFVEAGRGCVRCGQILSIRDCTIRDARRVGE